MAQQQLENTKKENILLACTYNIAGCKNVTIGYNAETLEPILLFTSDKKRFTLSASQYQHFDKEGSIWKLAIGGRQRRNIDYEKIRLRLSSSRQNQPQATFVERETNKRFTFDNFQLAHLIKLRTVISSYIFTLTVNRLNMLEFYKQYMVKSIQRGCFLEYTDFVVPAGIFHSLDYLRLFFEIPVLCPNINNNNFNNNETCSF